MQCKWVNSIQNPNSLSSFAVNVVFFGIAMVELQKAAQSRVILPYVVHKHNQGKPIWSYALAAVMSNMMIVCIPGVVCWSNCAKIFGKLHFWGVNHQVHEQFIQAESLNEATQSQ